ncbi:hypothetical protein AB0M83_47180 [Amycolatopsis sp. NPDC051106]|uniref:hypothetical protein n=1 Tax=unclassified Amycolatopsis TaxID=2618356 RepID=UPI00343669B9
MATRSGLSVSTARRLTGELRAWGRLERLEDGRYRIGIRCGRSARSPRGSATCAKPRSPPCTTSTRPPRRTSS